MKKYIISILIALSVIAVGNAEVVSYFGKGAADDLGYALVNKLAGESATFAETEQVFMIMNGPWDKEEVAASATDQSLGTAGSTGDYLNHCNCQVNTSGATGTCAIEDGTNTAFDDIISVPASSPIGLYRIEVGSQATTAAGWEATTGAGATMQCYGRFDTAGD